MINLAMIDLISRRLTSEPTPNWREAVVDEKGRVERISYELCVLVVLRDAIGRREIFVEGGKRWGDPEDDLPVTSRPPAPCTTRRSVSRWTRRSSSRI
ncbi:hypothetical protein AB0I10_38360 [Streptomyces sp. NPDC050636]|uniref:hypothetical protein n=1 Tax=Streptomyces sp. NPDC050636 TaxID=3154510 RepID=UPI0034313B52